MNDAGYAVTVVYVPLSPWADAFDKELFANKPSINWVRAAKHPIEHPFHYKYIRLRRKGNEWWSRYMPLGDRHYEKVYVLYSQELVKVARSIQADLYIGHNLGALPAAVQAARKWKAKVAFDAEDYHRGESAPGSLHYNMAVAIEDSYIPALDYLSAASPLIAQKYQSHYPDKKTIVLNNVFGKQFLQSPATADGEAVGLFWFSQTAGTNRGLETVVEALNLLPQFNWSLTILGQCSDGFRQQLLGLSSMPDRIVFHSPVALGEIFPIASCFDIGLATEVPYCENRRICLTNKLFTYLLAANCIVASDTEAQQQFLHTYAGVGLLYKHDHIQDLADKLTLLMQDKHLLRSCRQRAYELADGQLNWEVESIKLLDTVRSVLL